MTHLGLLFLLSCWHQTATQGFGINIIQIVEDNKAQIACTVALLAKYFRSGEDLSGSVLHMSITSAPMQLQASLMHALHEYKHYSWTIVVENSHREGNNEANANHVLHEKPQCYFLVIENLENEDVDEIFESWQNNLNWNPLAQFVVYFASIEETDDEMTDIMTEILLKFMNKKIYNVNIIGQSEENSFYLSKTVFPYHPDNNCGNRAITIETLDFCDYQVIERETKEMNEENEEGEIEMEEVQEDDVELLTNVTEKESYGCNQSSNGKTKANNISLQDLLCSNGQKMLKYIEDNHLTISNTVPAFKNSNLLTSTGNLSDTYPRIHIRVEELHRALFLDKFPKDLSGCPLVAAFRLWEPYIFNEVVENNLPTLPTEIEENNEIWFNLTNGEDDLSADDLYIFDKQEDTKETTLPIHLNGIEYKLIQTIAERLHINVEMQMENKNVYYLFQQLVDGHIEMVVGGIDEDPSLSQFVSSTIPYHQDDLTWCVAKAQNIHNLFNFSTTFQNDSWLLILLFIVTACWNISIAKRCLKVRFFRSNIYVVGIILGQAIRLQPIPISLKCCFGTLFFMGFMFSNIYQSFSISTLTTPTTSHQISHLNEIYQNRMHIRGSVENVRHLNKEGEIYRYVREQFQICYNIEECLQQAAKDPKLAVVVSRQHFYYNPRIPRNKLYCFDRNENIYIYLVTMLMPKKFHLLHKINAVIQNIIESGHMQKWGQELDRRLKINEAIQLAREGQFKSLTLTQVIGSFLFNGLLLAFASWLFAMECAIYWLVVKRRTTLKLAKYIHKKFI